MKKHLFILSTLFAIFAISGCTSSSIFLIKGQSGKDPNIKAGKSVGATGDVDKKEVEKFADVKQGSNLKILTQPPTKMFSMK